MSKKSSWLFGLEGSLSSTKFRRRRYLPSEDSPVGTGQVSINRVYLFYIITFAILVVFLGRLFVLTVVFGQENKQLSENNRIQLVNVEAARGKIFDRRGVVVADSKNAFHLVKGNSSQEITKEQADDLVRFGLASRNFEGEMGRISEDVVRVFPFGMATSHVVGYVTSVSKEDLQADRTLTLNNRVGRGGVEETYDDFLRGRDGREILEVDAVGKKISVLGKVDPQPGRNVHLTIDAALQKVLFDALTKQADKIGTKRGSAVVENPETGEILALASVPSYDSSDISKSVEDVNKPFLNRAISGAYPPGSVFKLVTALAGLTSGKINKDTEFDDTGQIEVGGSKFANWLFTEYGRTDGLIKLQRAIARSNDIYFYHVGEEIGHDAIKSMAVKFGFGQKTGIDLPGEAFGLVPDEVWKKSAYNEDWFTGDTLHMAIGQGFVLATPIQIAQMTSFMATGAVHKPYLVSKIDAGFGARDFTMAPKVTVTNPIVAENYNLVRDGMRMACQTGGTAFPFFDSKYTVGCKTGTAEKSEGNPNAWFTAFAPFEKPQIAVTVMIEEGGEGSVVAAPVAKEVLDWYFANLPKRK